MFAFAVRMHYLIHWGSQLYSPPGFMETTRFSFSVSVLRFQPHSFLLSLLSNFYKQPSKNKLTCHLRITCSYSFPNLQDHHIYTFNHKYIKQTRGGYHVPEFYLSIKPFAKQSVYFHLSFTSTLSDSWLHSALTLYVCKNTRNLNLSS